MLKREEAALPRLREGDCEKVSRLYKAKTGVGCGVGCGGFHPKVPLDMTKETRGGVVEFLEKVERSGKMAAAVGRILVHVGIARISSCMDTSILSVEVLCCVSLGICLLWSL